MKRVGTGHMPVEVWLFHPDYWQQNDGYGLCNTASGFEVICTLGGIGCNVDHAFVKVRNLVAELKT